MSNLKVDYVKLGDIIDDMKKCETTIEVVYGDMKTTVEALVNNGYMEAISATAYVTEFNSLLAPEIESLKTLINKYYNQLSEICEKFNDADYKLAQGLGGMV